METGAKHFGCMCWLLQGKGFPCLAGEEVVWQSCVCQHKDFTQNMLTLISGSPGLCPFAFFSFRESLFFFLCTLGTLDIPKFNWSCSLCVSPGALSRVSTWFFSSGTSSLYLLPLWWLLSLTHLVLCYHDSSFLVLIPWLKTGNCAGFSSGEEMPWQQLPLCWGFLCPEDHCGWFCLRIRFTSPPASLVTVLLLQVFCKVAVTKNAVIHTSEMAQDLCRSWEHFWEELS